MPEAALSTRSSAKVLVIYRDASDVQPYARAIESTGALPVLEEARRGLTIGNCSGLLLTGGDDVNPAFYGETAAPQTEPPDDERDAIEAALINEVLARDIPLLAICRGLQILNVALGGTLIQHVEDAGRHVTQTPDKGRPAHRVIIEPGTLLSGIAAVQTWDVNSRHHQAVARLGEGLRICATDPDDGTVEAIEFPGRRYVLGVQWHPENQVEDPQQRGLFQSFADAL